MVGTVYVTEGEAIVADLIDGTSSTHLDGTNSYIEWGIGTTDPVKGNSDIETTAPEARVLCTISQPAADTNQWVGTITSAAGATITEVCLFDHVSAASGNLVIRSVFGGVVLAASDAIEFTITLQQT